jgi:hypothetical protein
VLIAQLSRSSLQRLGEGKSHSSYTQSLRSVKNAYARRVLCSRLGHRLTARGSTHRPSDGPVPLPLSPAGAHQPADPRIRYQLFFTALRSSLFNTMEFFPSTRLSLSVGAAIWIGGSCGIRDLAQATILHAPQFLALQPGTLLCVLYYQAVTIGSPFSIRSLLSYFSSYRIATR